MRILIMGLPGSGKTTLTHRIVDEIPSIQYLNADDIRRLCDEWDFSIEGRCRQALRMRVLSENGYFICDTVCPTEETRRILDPDFVIWMNTIEKSRFEDTNQLFEKPIKVDIEINTFEYSTKDIVKRIIDV